MSFSFFTKSNINIVANLCRSTHFVVCSIYVDHNCVHCFFYVCMHCWSNIALSLWFFQICSALLFIIFGREFIDYLLVVLLLLTFLIFIYFVGGFAKLPEQLISDKQVSGIGLFICIKFMLPGLLPFMLFIVVLYINFKFINQLNILHRQLCFQMATHVLSVFMLLDNWRSVHVVIRWFFCCIHPCEDYRDLHGLYDYNRMKPDQVKQWKNDNDDSSANGCTCDSIVSFTNGIVCLSYKYAIMYIP